MASPEDSGLPGAIQSRQVLTMDDVSSADDEEMPLAPSRRSAGRGGKAVAKDRSPREEQGSEQSSSELQDPNLVGGILFPGNQHFSERRKSYERSAPRAVLRKQPIVSPKGREYNDAMGKKKEVQHNRKRTLDLCTVEETEGLAIDTGCQSGGGAPAAGDATPEATEVATEDATEEAAGEAVEEATAYIPPGLDASLEDSAGCPSRPYEKRYASVSVTYGVAMASASRLDRK